MDIKLKFYDYSSVKIECEDSIFFELRDYFSFETPGYQFNPKFKYGQWDGKIRILGYDGLLPYGLVDYVKKFADNMDYKVEIDPKITDNGGITEKEISDWVDSKEVYSGSTKITPHWYQKDSVVKGLTQNRALLNLPTSAGKSLIQALLARYYIENFQGKVLILVPTTILVKQMIDDLVDYRLFSREMLLGIKGGTAKDSDALVYVSTWQTAIKQPKEWFGQFGMLMNDECHLATGKSISTIINGLSNCKFKFGLTGTVKDGKANVMQYIGLFGNIYRPVSTAELMEAGQVSKLKINTLFLRYPDAFTEKVKGFAYQDEIKIIIKAKQRNEWIAKLACKLGSKDENVFVMFDRIAHGKDLYEYCKSIHGEENVFFIAGEVKDKDRDIIKAMAEKRSGMVVVASYGVFSAGVSIKNLHHVIFAHPIKSKVTVLQSIGRVLRLHGSKAEGILWDIVDDMGVKPKSKNTKKKYVHLNYALKHALERIERYASEKFDYSMREVKL